MIKQAMATAFLCLCALGAHAEVVNVDNAELARLAASGAAVIDIRTAPEWKETGVLSGSKLLTFFDDRGRVDAPAWLEHVKSITKPGQAVVLICRSGNRSRTAAQYLSQQPGFKTVYNVTGGINSWSKEGRTVVPSNSPLAMCAAGAVC